MRQQTKDLLITKADELAHQIYSITNKFPKEEIFGITSQLRRSSLSIVLNLIEGFARLRETEYIRFLEIAYGSLKETKYLIHFCYKENYFDINQYRKLLSISDEIGRMIWERMQRIKRKVKKSFMKYEKTSCEMLSVKC